MTADEVAADAVPGRVRDQLGLFGVWRGGREVTAGLALALEQFGYGTLWIGGSPGGDLAQVEQLLAATTALKLATGIVNIWQDDAPQVAASFQRIESRQPGRFLLGVGAGHREATQQYEKPYQKLVDYVDTLLTDGVPKDSLVLAALGPKVLRLAAERTAGAHPYLVTTEYTRRAREIVGPGPLLAPDHKVVLDTDLARARALGRSRVKNPYLGLVNYTNNLRRLGWGDDDLSGDGSDALIDALVAHGSPDEVAAALTRHLDAGADHVAIQLLTAPGTEPRGGYRQLAQALRL
jgi:probable F420-dependent oxidoreductase